MWILWVRGQSHAFDPWVAKPALVVPDQQCACSACEAWRDTGNGLQKRSDIMVNATKGFHRLAMRLVRAVRVIRAVRIVGVVMVVRFLGLVWVVFRVLLLLLLGV